MKIMTFILRNPFVQLLVIGSLLTSLAGCTHGTGEANSDRRPRSITFVGDDIQHVSAGDVVVEILQVGDEVSVQVDYRDATSVYDFTFSPKGIRSHTKVERDGEMFVVLDEDGDGLPDVKSEFRPERRYYRILHSFEKIPFPEKSGSNKPEAGKGVEAPGQSERP